MSAHYPAGSDTYSVNDLCKKLGLSRLQVFELIGRNEFRSIHVQGCTRIMKQSFDKWCSYCDNSHYNKSNNHKSRANTTRQQWVPKLKEIRSGIYRYVNPYGKVQEVKDPSEYTTEEEKKKCEQELIEYLIREQFTVYYE